MSEDRRKELARDRRDDASDVSARRILIIKHGALGDFIQAFGPFQAIRRHHARDRLVLLTTAPYVALAEASGLFDHVWVDDRPGLLNPLRLWALAQDLRQAEFDRVYDLQTSSRSSWYFHLFNRFARPEWSGISWGCSLPHDNPDRDLMHTVERQADQLRLAGIDHVPPPDFSWMKANVAALGVGRNFVLFVAGGSAHRPAKRWPSERFAKLARLLAADGIRPVLLGTEAEAGVNHEIAATCPEALDLTGQTDLFAIGELARRARGAIGNDTGPMHLIAAMNCPALVLFSAESDPALCAPRGGAVTVLRRNDLRQLDLDEVVHNLSLRTPPRGQGGPPRS